MWMLCAGWCSSEMITETATCFGIKPNLQQRLPELVLRLDAVSGPVFSWQMFPMALKSPCTHCQGMPIYPQPCHQPDARGRDANQTLFCSGIPSLDFSSAAIWQWNQKQIHCPLGFKRLGLQSFGISLTSPASNLPYPNLHIAVIKSDDGFVTMCSLLEGLYLALNNYCVILINFSSWYTFRLDLAVSLTVFHSILHRKCCYQHLKICGRKQKKTFR